jgi:hypothetical protein
MATTGTHPTGTTGSGQFKRNLETLQIALVSPAPAAKPIGKPVASLHGPKMFHVCILDEDDYIAVTQLRGCTGLALYDAASKLGAMYHFGGQFGSEQQELGRFAKDVGAHPVELDKLQIWLFGGTKCGYANKLLVELRKLGFMQTPTVMQVDGTPNQGVSFYLLGTGVVTDQLT